MNAHPIPIEALDGKVGVLGITGSGKTFTAIGMVEQLLELGRQVIIVDPTGAYHGLRTVFPLPIFGGLAGDLPIGEADGERIARVLVDRNVSAIIDVSLLLKESHAAARRFMAGFVAALKNAPARARYMVMDEADEFMPENVGGGDAKLFGDLKWIVRRGRKDGWRMLMVTQRPQDIAKSVLTQCETLVIHKLTAPQDRKAIEEWVKGNADAGQAKEVLGSLARLDTGEAWIWSPRHDLLVRTRLPVNRSADTSRTPDADDEPVALARLDAADLDEIREVMAAPGSAAAAVEAYSAGAAAGEALRERDERIADLIRANAECADHITEQLDRLVELEADRDLWRDRASRYDQQIRNAVQALGFTNVNADVPEPIVIEQNAPTPAHGRPKFALPSVPPPPPAQMPPQQLSGAGTPSARKMIDALARFYPRALSIDHAARIGGVSTKSSQWRANRAAFEASPLVKPFVVAGQYELTTAGRDAYGLAERPDDPAALLTFWIGSFPPATGAMLRAIAAADGPLTRAEVAERAGVSPTSSGLGSGLRELRDQQLIEPIGDAFQLARSLR